MVAAEISCSISRYRRPFRRFVVGSVRDGGACKRSATRTTDMPGGAHDLDTTETNAAGTSSAPSDHVTFATGNFGLAITRLNAPQLSYGTGNDGWNVDIPSGGLVTDLIQRYVTPHGTATP